MHVDTQHRPPFRVFTRALLLFALLAASLTLTHCRLVGDRLTGIGVDQFASSSDCIKKCKDTYKVAIKTEKDLHKMLAIQCNGNTACLTAEEARYQAALRVIEATYADCLNQCHLQGSGTVGP